MVYIDILNYSVCPQNSLVIRVYIMYISHPGRTLWLSQYILYISHPGRTLWLSEHILFFVVSARQPGDFLLQRLSFIGQCTVQYIAVLRSQSRSRSRWSQNYWRPGAGAEIIFLINISYSQFGGCQDEEKRSLRHIYYTTCYSAVLSGNIWQELELEPESEPDPK